MPEGVIPSKADGPLNGIVNGNDEGTGEGVPPSIGGACGIMGKLALVPYGMPAPPGTEGMAEKPGMPGWECPADDVVKGVVVKGIDLNRAFASELDCGKFDWLYECPAEGCRFPEVVSGVGSAGKGWCCETECDGSK